MCVCVCPHISSEKKIHQSTYRQTSESELRATTSYKDDFSLKIDNYDYTKKKKLLAYEQRSRPTGKSFTVCGCGF